MAYRSMLNKDSGDLFTGTRLCRACGVHKSMADFHWGTDRACRARTCKSCYHRRQRERIARNQEQHKANHFEAHMRRTYGLSVSAWQDLLTSQGYACAICRVPIDRSTSHVDHDHGTGAIRGLLCFCCNTALGKFRDSVERLEAAIRYLQAPVPPIPRRSRDLDPAERHERRVKAAADWHQSPEGKAITKARSERLVGQANASAKLTDMERAEIVSRYRVGDITQQDLGLEYNVSPTTIWRIVTSATRKHTKTRALNNTPQAARAEAS